MPTIPRAQCATYRCKQPTRPGSVHCVDHAPTPRVNQAKRETDREYKTAVWQTIRTGQLSISPLCQCCQLAGLVVAANVVDHVIPWKTIGPHAFTANRFQSLCANCHSVKTGLESRGVYRHYQPGGAVDYSPGDWGRMLAQPDPDPVPPRD
jgi:5-methylcytosine-specific restriction protein A